MAMAMTVPSRLWLGRVVSARRDLILITAVVKMVRRAAKNMAFLVCVDGLASSVTAFTRVFRDPVRTGKAGRPRLAALPGWLLGQVIKHHSGRRLVSVTRRVVLGTAAAIAATLTATGTGTGINTSYIERLNATFRGALCPLVRRGPAGAMRVDQHHQVAPLSKVGLEQRDHVGLLIDHQPILVGYGRRQCQEEAAARRAEDGHAASLPGLG
ncbi:MAG TPA: hypothetical protein VKP69_06815 [Isosphaeraceae bacterium]|nr:hypothetical protein [Isosphaeraceae bacterium]